MFQIFGAREHMTDILENQSLFDQIIGKKKTYCIQFYLNSLIKRRYFNNYLHMNSNLKNGIKILKLYK